MNRRNFVVGLGTVATISGVASVTAASFADSVTASSDFRVIVDENLTLELGNGVPEEADLDTTESWSDESLGDFSGVEFDDADDGQLAYIEDIDTDPEDTDINTELAVANDPDIQDQDGYEEFLAVTNDGISDQEVGIEYVFGPDVDTTGVGPDYGDESDGTLTPEQVVELFTFEENGGEQISPEEADVEQAQFTTVAGGETVQLDLNIDLTEGTADDLADNADVEDNIFSSDDGAGDDFQLLEEIRVGVEPDE